MSVNLNGVAFRLIEDVYFFFITQEHLRIPKLGQARLSSLQRVTEYIPSLRLRVCRQLRRLSQRLERLLLMPALRLAKKEETAS